MTAMILRYEHGQMEVQRTYRNALSLRAGVTPVLSIVGAGGKTTTARYLAQEYVEAGEPVVVTTTTHMEIREKPWFLLEESMSGLQEKLRQEGQVWFGIPSEARKDGIRRMHASSAAYYEQVLRLRIPLIVEADGARRLPCKAPGDREPVLAPGTTDVLAVYGLDAVGGVIQEVCFRPERVADILRKSTMDRLTPGDIAALALSREGGRKLVQAAHRYTLVLNKADNEERLAAAQQICKQVEETLCCRQEHADLRMLITSHNGAETGRRNS